MRSNARLSCQRASILGSMPPTVMIGSAVAELKRPRPCTLSTAPPPLPTTKGETLLISRLPLYLSSTPAAVNPEPLVASARTSAGLKSKGISGGMVDDLPLNERERVSSAAIQTLRPACSALTVLSQSDL